MDGPHLEYNPSEVEDQKREIREILGTLNLITPLNKSSASGVRTPSMPGDPQDDAATSVSQNRTYLAHPRRPGTEHQLPCFPDFEILACRRLVRRAFAPHELPSLIEAIFPSEDEGDTIRSLLGDDVQTFIDVIDEVRSTYIPSSAQIS